MNDAELAASIKTPVRLLRAMTYELGHQSLQAADAGRRLLLRSEPSDIRGSDRPPTNANFWPTVQEFMVYTATVANFIWPPRPLRKDVEREFPNRSTDIALILGMSSDHDLFEDVRKVRNSFVHINERFEEFWIDNGGSEMSARLERVYTAQGDFLSWNGIENSVNFLDTTVHVRPVVDQLDQIHERASAGLIFLFDCEASN